MKVVITYGTFDLLHYGHIRLLKRAKDMGDYLIVGLSTDKFNEEGKGKKAFFSYKIRKEILESVKYVDKIIPQHSFEQKVDDIINNHVDIHVSGDDWKGKWDYLRQYCEVIYLPRTKNISTSLIKESISNDKQRTKSSVITMQE